MTQAGADAVELNFSCPNMEAKGVGVDIGQDPDLVRRLTAAARRGTDRPILAKMTPNLADMRPAARAAMEGGASGIAAINTVKSITNVNLDTHTTAPAVRGRSAVGEYSGAAVKPIALRFLVGLGVESVVDAALLERDTVVYPRFHRERCVGCGRCYLSCRDGGHQALRFDAETRRPVLAPERCVGCHLCVLVCPREAIVGGGRRVAPKR